MRRSFLIQIEDTSKESENQTCVTRRTKEDNCFGKKGNGADQADNRTGKQSDQCPSRQQCCEKHC